MNFISTSYSSLKRSISKLKSRFEPEKHPERITPIPTCRIKVTVSLRYDQDLLELESDSIPQYSVEIKQYLKRFDTWAFFKRGNIHRARSLTFNMAYCFGTRQTLKFIIFEGTDGKKKRAGWSVMTLGAVVAKREQVLKIYFDDSRLTGLDNGCELMIEAEECRDNAPDEVEINMAIQDIFPVGINTSCMGMRMKPYLVVSKVDQKYGFVTQVYRNNFGLVNLLFQKFLYKIGVTESWAAKTIEHTILIQLCVLCDNDFKKVIRFELFDKTIFGRGRSVNQVHTTLQKMLDGPHPLHLKPGEEDNRFEVIHCTLRPSYSFMQYIQGGAEIRLCFAIDFSLNSRKSPDGNVIIENNSSFYESVMGAVGECISCYGQDAPINIRGFGARDPTKVKYEFGEEDQSSSFLIGNFSRLDQAIRAYHLSHRKMKGLPPPGLWEPSIRHLLDIIRQQYVPWRYYVMFIICETINRDIDETLKAFVECSFHPLSIVVIGRRNRPKIQRFYPERKLVTGSGLKANRNILTFVSGKMSLELIARLSVENISHQFEHYMRSQGLNPNTIRHPPVASSKNPEFFDRTIDPPSWVAQCYSEETKLDEDFVNQHMAREYFFPVVEKRKWTGSDSETPNEPEIEGSVNNNNRVFLDEVSTHCPATHPENSPSDPVLEKKSRTTSSDFSTRKHPKISPRISQQIQKFDGAATVN